ncbi:thiol reductase thioredoxin [Candidatus Woesebacteria bacterium]|nr:thiol reductase thioredoxin [Candidatus Woesebacteria bacterium]
MNMMRNEGTPIGQIETISNLDEILADTGDSVVMVEFVADWCGPCKMFKPILERAVVANSGAVKLYTVDSELLPDIAAKYGVSSIPHVLFFYQGELIKRQVGFLPEKQFDKLLEGLLVAVKPKKEAQ